MKIPTLAPRSILLIAGLVALALMALYIPSCLQHQRSRRAQSRVDQAQANSTIASAGDASNTQAAVNANEVESEALGRSNEKEIRNAQGSDAPVAAPARAATIAALCLRRVYRDTPRCRLLNAR